MTTDPNSSNKRKADDLDLKTPPTPPMYQQDEQREGYRKLSTHAADIALDYYNKNNHFKYELLHNKPLDSNNFVDHRGFWTHCCFYAKDSSIKQFFAEIHLAYLSEMAVTCIILEGNTKVGCEFCKSVIHPVVGFQAGCSKYNRLASSLKLDNDKDPLVGPNFDVGLVEKDRDSGRKSPASPPTHNQENMCRRHRARSPPFPRLGGVPPYAEYEQAWRVQNITYANIVLDYYNKKNNTKFELVEDEAMASNVLIYGGLWIHCSFTATNDSCTQPFFGEVEKDKLGNPTVKTCMVLEQGKTKVGCLLCKAVIHPVEGYIVACPKNSRRASSSISDHDKTVLKDNSVK